MSVRVLAIIGSAARPRRLRRAVEEALGRAGAVGVETRLGSGARRG